MKTKQELKTLKDLKERAKNLGSMVEVVTLYELKAEAVKWVKYIGVETVETEWIKHFFNLTVEDLK